MLAAYGEDNCLGLFYGEISWQATGRRAGFAPGNGQAYELPSSDENIPNWTTATGGTFTPAGLQAGQVVNRVGSLYAANTANPKQCGGTAEAPVCILGTGCCNAPNDCPADRPSCAVLGGACVSITCMHTATGLHVMLCP